MDGDSIDRVRSSDPTPARAAAEAGNLKRQERRQARAEEQKAMDAKARGDDPSQNEANSDPRGRLDEVA